MNQQLRTTAVNAERIVQAFNSVFLTTHNTQLRGGADEPFYRPAKAGLAAVILFRADYVRSALHEVAHWCVAGTARRALPDYGYWYSPDDRNLEEQRAFFSVEARPQAIEKHFCAALGIPFTPSIDNLSLTIPEPERQCFVERLEEQYRRYTEQGLPERARRFQDALSGLTTQSAA